MFHTSNGSSGEETQMSDMETARSDLAFLRELVDEDWRPGLWGFGALYVALGVALAVHVTLSWVAMQGIVPLHGRSLAAAYVALYSVFAGAPWLVCVRSRALFGAAGGWKSPGASVKGRAGAATLGGAFLAHLVIMVAFVIAARRLDDDRIVELLPVTLFALQGVAWIVVHALRRQGWQIALAGAWFTAALGVPFLLASAWFAPFVAAVAMVLMVLPGIYMMRAARKSD
jgi:hypothetical protein